MAGPEDRPEPGQALRRLLVPLAVLAVALVLTGAGLYQAFVRADLAWRGKIVWGEVVEHEQGGPGEDAQDFLVIEFKPDEIRTITIRHSESMRPTGLEVGDPVPMNFLPEAPENARVLESINWVPPVILLLLGPVLLVLAIRGIRIESERLAGRNGDAA